MYDMHKHEIATLFFAAGAPLMDVMHSILVRALLAAMGGESISPGNGSASPGNDSSSSGSSVVILASELLKRANELVKNSIHPTSIMSGYRLAMKESIKFIKDQLAVKTGTLGRDVAFNIAKTTLSSKIFGRESEFFANLAVDALTMVKTESAETGKAIYPIKAVGILKQHGRSFKDSQLINGYVMYGGRAGQGVRCEPRLPTLA